MADSQRKTENLWGNTIKTNKYIDEQGSIVILQNSDIFDQKGITVIPSSNYTFSWSNFVIGTNNNVPYIRICSYTTNGGTFINRTLIAPNVYPDKYATFTVPSNCTYVDIRIDNETSMRGQHFVNLMLNAGTIALPYEPYGWVHSLRKQTTASGIIVPPTTIYTDGSNITAYTIKGNTVQNGIPSPQNPISVQGVGELDDGQYKIPILTNQTTTNIYLGSVPSTRQIQKLVFDGTETSWKAGGGFFYNDSITPDYLRTADRIIYCTHYQGINSVVGGGSVGNGECSFYSAAGVQRLYIHDDNYSSLDTFKAYLAQQYANGTPVTVWYVLATAETATVNEPLMKIGDYADTLSNAAQIPTTEGANSITVDTTVQPSEFTATWTGWHDASVKGWDGSQWQ